MNPFSPYAAIIYLLLGLLWPPLTMPEEKLAALEEHEQQRFKARRAWQGILRMVGMVSGAFLLIAHPLYLLLTDSPDLDITDSGTLYTLAALYGVLLLAIQRTEKNRRIATLIFMAFCGFIVFKYADYRDYSAESYRGFYLAIGGNTLFWLLIGRHFPPGSSTDIHVFGLDDME